MLTTAPWSWNASNIGLVNLAAVVTAGCKSKPDLGL